MTDDRWPVETQVEGSRNRAALKARIAEVLAEIRSPDCQRIGRLLDLLEHRIAALGDDPPV